MSLLKICNLQSEISQIFISPMKPRTLVPFLLLLSLFFMNLPAHADKSSLAPDLIIINAVVHTMDASQPVIEAIAVYGNRIMAVGSTKDIRKLAGSNTRVIDAKKRLVL